MDACYFIRDGGGDISYVSPGLFYFIKSTFVLNCIHNEEILKVNIFFFSRSQLYLFSYSWRVGVLSHQWRMFSEWCMHTPSNFSMHFIFCIVCALMGNENFSDQTILNFYDNRSFYDLQRPKSRSNIYFREKCLV